MMINVKCAIMISMTSALPSLLKAMNEVLIVIGTTKMLLNVHVKG